MGQLENRLDKLEAVIRQKNKPSYEEYQAACKRSQTGVREHVERLIAKAHGEQVTEPVIDQAAADIDREIIRAYEGEQPPDPDARQKFMDKIDRIAERLKGAANNEPE